MPQLNYYTDTEAIADVSPSKYEFQRLQLPNRWEIFFCSYKEGHLYYHCSRCIKEIVYLHFQKRRMVNRINHDRSKYWLIIPNRICQFKHLSPFMTKFLLRKRPIALFIKKIESRVRKLFL